MKIGLLVTEIWKIKDRWCEFAVVFVKVRCKHRGVFIHTTLTMFVIQILWNIWWIRRKFRVRVKVINTVSNLYYRDKVFGEWMWRVWFGSEARKVANRFLDGMKNSSIERSISSGYLDASFSIRILKKPPKLAMNKKYDNFAKTVPIIPPIKCLPIKRFSELSKNRGENIFQSIRSIGKLFPRCLFLLSSIAWKNLS